MHYYFIACCTQIAQVAEPMLSRVIWTKLLVVDVRKCKKYEGRSKSLASWYITLKNFSKSIHR